jgi:aminopeptidase
MKEKFKKGAKNAVKCMNIKEKDKVVVITDYEKEDIADAVIEEIRSKKAEILKIIIEEEVGKRPVKNFPDKLKEKIKKFKPNVSYYIASAKKGEIGPFRLPLKGFLLEKFNCRHGHMVNIDEKIMMQGMSADYDKVYKINKHIHSILKKAKQIKVEAIGTILTATFDKKVKWVNWNGRIYKQGGWGNLPDGEVFTCPKKVDGKISAYLVGDYFSDKYRILKSPLILEIENSRITKIESKNKKLKDEFTKYTKSEKNGNRVGEFSIGTLIGLKGFIGNMLQDEKFPGIHIAFGSPFPELTKASWNSPNHVDVLPKKCNIWVDGRQIMKNGKFTLLRNA